MVKKFVTHIFKLFLPVLVIFVVIAALCVVISVFMTVRTAFQPPTPTATVRPTPGPTSTPKPAEIGVIMDVKGSVFANSGGSGRLDNFLESLFYSRWPRCVTVINSEGMDQSKIPDFPIVIRIKMRIVEVRGPDYHINPQGGPVMATSFGHRTTGSVEISAPALGVPAVLIDGIETAPNFPDKVSSDQLMGSRYYGGGGPEVFARAVREKDFQKVLNEYVQAAGICR